MAFSYAEGTITGLDVRPGTYSKIPDPEDVGGGNEPRIRVANGFKHRFDVFVEPDGSTTGLTLANLIAMAASKLKNWSITTTDTTIGTAGAVTGVIESVTFGGGAAMVATIVVAPSI